MSTKWDRRLKKLETVSVDLFKVIVCERDDLEEQRTRMCAPGEECECRDAFLAHMSRTRGAGMPVVIAYGDRAV